MLVSCFVLKQNSPALLPEFRAKGCDEIITTLFSGSFLRSQRFFTIAFIAKPGTNSVQRVAQFFGLNSAFPKHGTATL
jgi:hypothetical protein